MRYDRRPNRDSASRPVRHSNGIRRARLAPPVFSRSKRARGVHVAVPRTFMPPETWHEPVEEPASETRGYRIVSQGAGAGYRHVVTPEQVRARLEELPQAFVERLHVLQFSRMTRKKKSFPCYGLQWGSAVYLYPLEENLVEFYTRPPRPQQQIEARMYGAVWQQADSGYWKLIWTEQAAEDFYLNNILIHEIGHLVDDRNTRSVDRERYAEWFALEYGFKNRRKRRAL